MPCQPVDTMRPDCREYGLGYVCDLLQVLARPSVDIPSATRISKPPSADPDGELIAASLDVALFIPHGSTIETNDWIRRFHSFVRRDH